MLHPLAKENPGKSFVPANRAAACRYMKMITLPKLHDALRDLYRRCGSTRARRASPGSDRADGRDHAVGGRLEEAGYRAKASVVGDGAEVDSGGYARRLPAISATRSARVVVGVGPE